MRRWGTMKRLCFMGQKDIAIMRGIRILSSLQAATYKNNNKKDRSHQYSSQSTQKTTNHKRSQPTNSNPNKSTDR